MSALVEDSPTNKRPPMMVTLAYLTFVLTLGLVCWVFWSLFWPFEVLQVESDSFVVQNPGKIVHPGEDVITSFHLCKKKDLVKEISTTIVGDVLVALPPAQRDLAIGCYNTTIEVARVPDSFPPGDYSIRLTYTYKINALRSIPYHFETDRFTVPPVPTEKSEP